jgi:uncharacterized membrane protein
LTDSAQKDSLTRALYIGANLAYSGLFMLILLWEGWLAPSPGAPAGFWLVIKAVPLVLAARGVYRGNPKVIVIASLVVLLYFVEGVVLAYAGPGHRHFLAPIRFLATAEIILSTAFIVLAGQYVRRTFKRD